MQQICETRSYFVHSVRPGVILFIDTHTNFLFGADHEQLRYEDSVLTQGALIQVQQGFVNIRLGLECITSVYQQIGVFPNCLPPIQH